MSCVLNIIFVPGKRKKLVVNVGEKGNLLSSFVNIEKSRQYCINENINHSLFIK